DPKAATSEVQRPDEGAGLKIKDGVGIISLRGPLIRYAYPQWLMNILGLTSMETVKAQLRFALDSPSVRAILWDVDSPGGEVNGCAELAAMAFDARKSPKPSQVVASGDICSAAYWIGSAVGPISVGTTTLAPSIGVRAAFWRFDGEEIIEVVSSQTPRK